MKVSVIITVYNLEKYVGEAISSVLNQTVSPKEIIVVNDGSSDDSETEIKAFQNEVTYIAQEKNQGVLPAIIRGIKKSSGEIICFLDGDDVWMPNKLEKVIRIFEDYDDVSLVTHNYIWIDANSKSLNKEDKTHRNLRLIGESLPFNYKEISLKLKKAILGYKGVWLGSAFSIRSSVLDVLDFERDLLRISPESLGRSHQDQPLAAYLITKYPDKQVFFINETLFKYRVFGDNSSGSSRTLDKAVNTIKRSEATTIYTSSFVNEVQNSSFDREKKIQEGKLYYFKYLLALYTQKRKEAMFNFFAFLRHDDVAFREIVKELIRVVGVSLLGVNRFLRQK